MEGLERARDDALTPRRNPHPHDRGAHMQIIDLSQDIYEGMRVYPGHLKTV
jgi:hypothetical protein